jgi:hypothetical protein
MKSALVTDIVFLATLACAIQIEPRQSIQIFGWWDQPRLILTWDDIKLKNLTWSQLRKMKFTVDQLKRIQDDKTQWIQRGGIKLQDLLDTIVFPINPIADLQADLGEVWSMKWNAEQMQRMGMTYDDFIKKGMTPEIMAHFNMSLTQWVCLGFREKHIVPGAMSNRVFGMEEKELRRIINDYCDQD